MSKAKRGKSGWNARFDGNRHTEQHDGHEGGNQFPLGTQQLIFPVVGASGNTTTDSVESIPAGAQILSTQVAVTLGFNGIAPTVQVQDIPGGEIIFAQQAVSVIFVSDEDDQSASWSGGPVRVVLGGALTNAGNLTVTVDYEV